MIFSLFRRKSEKSIKKSSILHPKHYCFDPLEAKPVLDRIRTLYGLDFRKNENLIITKLAAFCKERGLYDFRQLYQTLLQNPALEYLLIDRLTVSETYFFRESSQLQKAIDLISKKSFIRILSAPCASGEEVYTLAILMEEFKPKRNYSIIGIDINTEALKKAEQGCYNQRSVARIPQPFKSIYLHSHDDNRYCVDPILKKNVIFRRINVLDPEIEKLGLFDIIFSRNMLIYFDNKEKYQAIVQFSKLLKPDGLLCLGHADHIETPESLKIEDKILNIYKKI